MKRLLSGRVFGMIAAIWATAVFILALVPNPPQVRNVDHFDKVEHAFALAFLTIVFGRWLEYGKKVRQPWLFSFATALVYGAAIEFAQYFLTTSRSAELADFAADAVGAGCAAAIMSIRRSGTRM